jgi:hypothetical protein
LKSRIGVRRAGPVVLGGSDDASLTFGAVESIESQ